LNVTNSQPLGESSHGFGHFHFHNAFDVYGGVRYRFDY
jgi:hypothetical protein